MSGFAGLYPGLFATIAEGAAAREAGRVLPYAEVALPRLLRGHFEVGGASAVTERFRLDRHWRNARTLASHNPLIYRRRIVGDYLLNGTSPAAAWALGSQEDET